MKKDVEQLSFFKASAAKLKRTRPRDELWDAWVDVWDEPRTRTERSRLNAALKELRVAGATADEVRRVLKAYDQEYPGMTHSPQGVTKNWTWLLNGSKPKAAGKQPTCPHGVSFWERCEECLL